MEPSAYYYGSFREHLAVFWQSLEERGSVSRVRMRLTPSRFAAQSATHFSVVDLVAHPTRKLPDHLVNVPVEVHVDFLCALVYTILIDQVMYAHRQMDYPEFHSITQYPKMDRTVGFSRTLMMANPYELFGEEVLSSRNLQRREVDAIFAKWAPFIVEDLCRFFALHKVGTTTWPEVKRAMLHDPSVTWGTSGAALAKALTEDPSAL